MPEIDEFEKMAEEVLNKVLIRQTPYVIYGNTNDIKDDIETALRNVHNKAIDKCMNLYASEYNGSYLENLSRLRKE